MPPEQSFAHAPQKEIIKTPEKLEYKLEVGANSIPSTQHLERNEDAMFQLAEKGSFGVFDGVGGEAAGDTASKIARDHIGIRLSELPDNLPYEERVKAIEQAFTEARQKIIENIARNPERAGMASTGSVINMFEDQGKLKAIIANVGDSRVYLLRDGKLQQITIDDNLAMATLSASKGEAEARKIQEKLNNTTDLSTLTEEEVRWFKQRGTIMNGLGSQVSGKPRLQTFDLRPHDVLFLTSDGNGDNLTDLELESKLLAGGEPEEIARQITQAARERAQEGSLRSKPDDMSAIIVKVEGSKASVIAEVQSGPEGLTERQKQHFTQIISSAQSFEDLFKALSEIQNTPQPGETEGFIQGSQKKYVIKDIKQTINELRTAKKTRSLKDMEDDLLEITSTYSLRNKVRDLLALELIQEKL